MQNFNKEIEGAMAEQAGPAPTVQAAQQSQAPQGEADPMTAMVQQLPEPEFLQLAEAVAVRMESMTQGQQ